MRLQLLRPLGIYRRVALASLLISLSALLPACGGGSGVGSSHHAAPHVAATVVGAGAPAAGNTFTVRAGSEVTLSGKDSDGVDAPVLTFQWRQLEPTAVDAQVTLAERNASTRVFVAPAVTSETDYVFELTGTDANGVSATQQVTVKVEPVLDANAFLTQPGRTAMLQIRIKRAGTTDCSASPPAGSAAAPFTLQLTQIVTWGDRVDPSVTRGPATPWRKTLSGQIDAGRACADLSTPLPGIVVDDINAPLEQENRRDERLELYRMDTVKAAIALDLTSGSGAALTANLTNAGMDISPAASSLVNPDAAGASFSVEYDLQDIRAKMYLPDADTGNAYYAALDPTGSGYSSTLATWLTHAGFTDSAGNPIGGQTIVKAIYTNNYDLGFGREMYLRRASDGSVYSYVINYPSLENALLGSDAFAVVAMEYSGYPGGTPAGCAKDKFVKFFAFVPDAVNGGFKRMPTMNFDGRGEKAIPGVCTACHGGTLMPTEFSGLDSTTKCGKADIDATFMPWDMDSLLFSDTDPSLNKTRFTTDQLAQYTRAAQQTPIRELNEAALATYLGDPTRHDASIRLIHGWYGEADANDGTPANYAAIDKLPAVTFDGSYVQSGWRSQPTLYHEVYASHCRACHTQLNPGTGATPAAKLFTTYDDFMSEAGSDGGLLRDYVYESGLMPFARLTMDRFWVPFAGGEAPAEILRAHLNSNGFNITSTPGDPIARFSVSPASNKYLDTPITLDASTSLFADNFSWSVTPASGLALGGNQGQTVTAQADTVGTYNVQLTVTSAKGSNSITQPVAIDNRVPVAANFIASMPDNATSIGIDLTSFSAFISAGGSLGDGLGSVAWTSNATGPESLSVANNVLTYSRTGGSGSNINSSFNYSITDLNGDTATGTITIQRSSTAPSSLAITGRATTSMSLSWTPASSAQVTGYRIYRSDAGGAEHALTPDLSASTTSFTDSTLTSDTSYAYRVASLTSGASGSPPQSQFSGQATANTKVSYINDIVPNYNSNSADWPCAGCHGDSATAGVSNLHLFNVALPNCLVSTPSCNTAMNGLFTTGSPAYQLIKTWYNDYGGSPPNNE